MAKDFKYICDFCGIVAEAKPVESTDECLRPPSTWVFIQSYKFDPSNPETPLLSTIGHLCGSCLPRPSKSSNPPESLL